MSKVLRLKDDVFSRLEINAKGFESPSDVVKRMIDCYEELETIQFVAECILSAEDFISETGKREKNILIHHPAEAIDRAMKFIYSVFPDYEIEYSYQRPALRLKIQAKQ